MDVPLNIVLTLVGAALAVGSYKAAFGHLQKKHEVLEQAHENLAKDFKAHTEVCGSSRTSQGARLGQVEELGRGLEGRMNGFMSGFHAGHRSATLNPNTPAPPT